MTLVSRWLPILTAPVTVLLSSVKFQSPTSNTRLVPRPPVADTDVFENDIIPNLHDKNLEYSQPEVPKELTIMHVFYSCIQL